MSLDINKDLLEALGVTSERIFGYVYAGVLTVIAAWLIYPTKVQDLLNASGSILTIMVVFGIGSGVFGLYWRVLGNLVLFRLTHSLHIAWDRLRHHTDLTSVTSSQGFLRAMGVDPGQSEAAYVDVKDSFSPVRSSIPVSSGVSPMQVRFFHAHGEVHFLYLVTIITFAAGVYVACLRPTPAAPWFVVSACAYLVAAVADIRLHAVEVRQMRTSEAELRQFLVDRGYLTPPPTARGAVPPGDVVAGGDVDVGESASRDG